MFLPFTPTLANFATERPKEADPTEKFLEKHKFCPKTAHSVVQAWCKKEKEKCKYLKIKHLHFVGYPEPGSNRHGLLHWCLRPARLPIPPSGLVAALFVPFRDFGSVVAVLIGRQHRRVDLLVKVCKDIANCLNYQLFCN